MSDDERRNFSDEEGEDVGFDDSDRDDSEEEEEDDEEEIKRVRTSLYGCDTFCICAPLAVGTKRDHVDFSFLTGRVVSSIIGQRRLHRRR
jgi:hypothetical protein